jgi:hypothetical protein
MLGSSFLLFSCVWHIVFYFASFSQSCQAFFLQKLEKPRASRRRRIPIFKKATTCAWLFRSSKYRTAAE